MHSIAKVIALSFLVSGMSLLAACGGSGGSSAVAEPVPPVEEQPPVDGGGEEGGGDAGDSESVEEFNPHWADVGVFSNAASCGNCHSAATDGSGDMRWPKQADGLDISPYAGWEHSVMAHAFNDPYYRATVQDEVKQFPSLAGTIEDKCLTCHSPMARTTAHSTGMLSTEACLSEDGCYRMESAEQDMSAREAISCTLCHQVDDEGLGENFSGSFHVDEEALTIYGPYLDPLAMPMRNNTRYDVAGAGHVQDSALCASCHDLDTPSVDVNTDQLTGRQFVEQAPYREWRNSALNTGGAGDQHCQDCHMPEIDGYQTRIATSLSGVSPPGWPVRDDYSQHFFLGGNTYLLELLRDYRADLGIADSTTVQGFEREIDRNTEFLTQQAARVSIDAIDLDDGQLDIAVSIVNKTGHKLPTSFPSRRTWLNLVIRDADGQLLFESGTPDDNGWLPQDAVQAGSACVDLDKPDDYDPASCYSPHFNVITESSQVAVYEAVMGDTNGNTTYMLLYGDVYLKDNRIPPAGFSTQGEQYSPLIATVGAAASDPDFNRDDAGEGTGRDTVHYQLDWQDLAGSGLQIEASLYYQTIRPGFVTGLQHSGEQIDQFRAMYDEHKPQPVVLASEKRVYP